MRLALVVACVVPTLARADTVASLLGGAPTTLDDVRCERRESGSRPAPRITVFEAYAFRASPARGLHASLPRMLADDVTVAGDTGARAATAPAAPATAPASLDWLDRRTEQLVELIAAPQLPVHVALLALLAAMALGALHALSPGHGKTIVGAYLVGSRSTPRHAVFLGVTVTLTHTLVVFAIGFVTLFASRYVLADRLVPVLGLLSGLLVLGMGVVLLMQRWKAARDAVAEAFARGVGRSSRVTGEREGAPYRRVAGARAQREHGMTRTTAHAHAHAHAHGLAHSHDGGTMHSHLPPAQATWRSLLALGMSGGLVPCPSALVLLLAAVALDKTVYGLLLVVSFSVGLALTLTGVGLAFLFARSRFRAPRAASPWPRILPALSAALIAIVGALLCYGALVAVATRTAPG